MKKILPYIFILLIIVNLFAPFSVGMNGNNSSVINKSVAEADNPTLSITVTPNTDGTSAVVSGTFWVTDPGSLTTALSAIRMGYYIGNTPDSLKLDPNVNSLLGESVTFNRKDTINGVGVLWYDYNYTLNNLTKGQTYYAKSTLTITNFIGIGRNTVESNVVSFVAGGASVNDAGKDTLPIPPCGIGGSNGFLGSGLASGTITGCAAQLIYYVLFIPTSYIFALTGQLFDFTFSYSVKDTSYNTPFVITGWGLVRDFVNLFFIFVLLYIAFATILEIHGFKTKEMIINVVIIGLLINFSLFATQIIIDTSNILARVFYNSNAIKITQNASIVASNGVTNNTPGLKIGPNGEIPLSAAIVNKINPQNLIINGMGNVSVGDPVSKTNTNAESGGSDLSVGSFILITLLAIAVNVVGIIVFISVSIIFITRVIGLWLAMIFAPLAFFSYTVPSMQGMGMVGWKKWWPDTLKLAFLAPIFIFFLYLIIEFLDTGLSLIKVQGQKDIAFIVATVVPFAFIMVLMWKAKDIASDLSGKLGQSISGGIAALGGIALGGAALTTAFIGRNTVGSTAKYIQNDSKRQKDSFASYKEWSLGKKLNPLSYTKAVSAGVAKQAFKIETTKTTIDSRGDKIKVKTNLGKEMQASDKSVEERAHAEHELDKKTQEIKGNPNAKFKDLTEPEQQSIKDRIDRDIVSKEMFNKTYDKLDVKKGEKADVDTHKELSGSWANSAADVKKDAEERHEHVHTASDMEKATKASAAMGEFVQALRKGSMDVRNLSQMKTKSRGITKFGVGLIAGVATGVRTGLKQSGINHGSGQADFLKDIGHTITEAIKSANINIKIEQSHGKSADEAHKEGGGGHH